MKSARELYGDEMDRKWFCVDDYQPIVDSIGNVVLQVDDNDYQGDSRILYQDGERFGWLQFGWGSCSGCDALQSCKNEAQVDELIVSLHASVKWFDSAAEALEYFKGKDWSTDYSWHSSEQMDFVAKAVVLLSQATNN